MLRKLASHSLVYGLAQITARGAQVLTLLALPLLLAPQEYGALQLLLTVAVIANVVVPLEITQGLARYYSESSILEKPAWAGSALSFTLVTTIGALALSQIAAPALNRLLFGDTTLLSSFRIGAAFIALNILFYFVQNQFRWMFQIRGYIVVSVVFAVATTCLTLGLASTAQEPLLGALWGQGVGTALATAIGLWMLRQHLSPAWDREKFNRMFCFSLPLVPAQIALFTSLYLGRLVLNGETDLDQVGLFALASQIAAVASLLIVGLQAAITPLVMAHHSEPGTPTLLAHLFEAFFVVATLVTLLLGLLAPEIIALLNRPDYSEAAPLVLPLTAAAMLSQAYVFGPGFAVARRTDKQLIVSLFGAATSVVANFILIDQFGIEGAAGASLLSAVVFILGWMALSQRLYPIPVRWVRVGAFGGAAALGASALGAMPGVPGLSLRLGSVILLVMLAILLGLLRSPRRISAEIRVATTASR